MDLPTLRDTDFAALYETADAYDELCKAFTEHADTWKETVDDRVRSSGWSGTAGDAAGQSLGRTTSRLRAAEMELGVIGEVLRGGADALLLAQSLLHRALADAEAAGVAVDDRGRAADPPLPPSARRDPDAELVRARSRQAGDRITAALAQAAAADRDTAERLRHYTARARGSSGLDLASALADRVGFADGPLDSLLTGMPGTGAPPAAVNAWWRRLTPDEQQRLITTHPDLFGTLDGVPGAARDQANRLLLPRLIATYEGRPEPLSAEDREKLDGFRAIRDRLAGRLDGGAGGPGSQPPLLLLSLSDAGRHGRAVLSWGDPDTARNVCALVPGLNSTLAAAGDGDTATALRVHRAAEEAQRGNGQDPSTASVIWFGYDAPRTDRSVVTTDRAVAGAAAYDAFLDGLRAAHQGGEPAHVTAIGHSYGSLLVGQAAQRPGGIAANDIVLVGSPGTGADHASHLAVGADHVYVGSAMWDPVTRLPSGGAAVLPGLDPAGRWFGRDPASAGFGAQRFQVADGRASDAHDNYFGKNGKGGDSLANIGRIVAGHGDQITREAGR